MTAYKVYCGNIHVGTVYQRTFTRERRTEGKRYVNARWESPMLWTFARPDVPHDGLWPNDGWQECKTRKEAIHGLLWLYSFTRGRLVPGAEVTLEKIS